MKTLSALIVLAVLSAAPSLASAQSIDGYRLNVYPAGAAPTATPITFFDFTKTAIECNQAPEVVPPGVPVNPRRVLWDDPDNAGRVCRWVDPGTGPLFAVPFGASYDAGLQAYNEAGRGPESDRVPFSRLSPPTVAPTGLRLIRLAS